MSEIKCVIGGNYGDEGKGLMTDYYAAKNPDALVVRANGGGQAGHTVVTPDGQSHVFSHIGAGMLTGNDTFLSYPFVVNPMTFYKEYEHSPCITNNGFPTIHIDERCIVTTPFDMMINQIMENDRGDSIHGSCGIGFSETINRNAVHERITIGALNNATDTKIFDWCKNIIRTYIPTRIRIVPPTYTIALYSDQLIYDFIDNIRHMLSNVNVVNINDLSSELNLVDRPIIFEGAQGLLLDMNYGFFPHVTRSNCGMKNISRVIADIGGKHNIEVNYITRAYTTRHGAGPLEHEDNTLPQRHDIVDTTNIPNDWQKSLRFAPLNLDNFDSVTAKDFALHAPKGATKVATLTCIDQMSDIIPVVLQNKISQQLLTGVVRDDRFKYRSFGPTRNDVMS